MLVLSRTVGTSVLIEDVTFTIVTIGNGVADASLRKRKGERPRVISLIQGETIEICYGVTVALIKISERSVRLGFEFPPGINFTRSEHEAT